MTPAEFASKLVLTAQNSKDKSLSCAPPSAVPKVALWLFEGWSFGLDVYEHPENRLIKLSEDIIVQHYRLSARLHPRGRSSTAADWQTLGSTVREILTATGHPGSPVVEPVLPIESVHPSSTIHWMWHSNGSRVDERVLEATAKVVQLLQKHEIELAEKNRAAAAAQDPGRNELCPCGSGKKFKKCHGGAN